MTHPLAVSAPETSQADAVDAALVDGPGFAVLRRLVPAELVEAALRLLNLEIVRRGLTPKRSPGARRARSSLPCAGTRRFSRSVPVERALAPRSGEEWADTQLLLRFPDEAQSGPFRPIQLRRCRRSDKPHMSRPERDTGPCSPGHTRGVP